MENENWERNDIQFPRLLAELYMSGITDDDGFMNRIADSMDLELGEIYSIFDRAQEVWDNIVAQTPGKIVVKNGKGKMSDQERIKKAIDIAVRYGGIDGGHHKAWVIDQMVRKLAGPQYKAIVKDACDGEEGPNTYSWDVGIAP